MSTDFVVTARNNTDRYIDYVSKDDSVLYNFDFNPWQDSADEITSITWKSEYGETTITDQSFENGVASALLSFPQRGYSLVSILATTATEKKKVWLSLRARDFNITTDDYGYYE